MTLQQKLKISLTPGQSPEPFEDTFTDDGAPDDLPF